MMDAGRHPRIEILTCAELVALEGEPGAFEARVRLRPTGVDRERCTGCGDCADACPVVAPNAFDLGLGARRAIFRPFPQAVPAAYAIDPDLCLNDGALIACDRCRRACTREAIDLGRLPSERRLSVGAVVVATGFEEFDPRELRAFGYGVYPDVVTSLELERMLNASGPTRGAVVRPSDRKPPRRLAYVQCVGSRGEADHPWCSRFCCMNAAKDALLLKQHEPGLESVTILYTDVRACGKGFEEFSERARASAWVEFVRGRPARVNEVPNTGELELAVEDTESGRPLRLRADLVVLSCGGVPAEGTADLAARLGIERNAAGFFALAPGPVPVASSRAGIFVCGSAAGPQVIPECVAQGSAAAVEAAILLASLPVAEAPCAGAEEAPEPSGSERPVSEPLARDDDEDGPAATRMGIECAESDARPGGDGPPASGAGTPDGDGRGMRGPIYPDEQRADEAVASGGEPRVGVFLCHCGANIGGVLAMPELLAYARSLPGVVHASEELFACSSTSQTAIQEAIARENLNRIVVAACTPRTHEPVFRQNCRAAGLNPYLLEMVNVRDQCSWVHAERPVEATAKARDLLRMALARARRLEPLQPTEVPVRQSALVLGAGLAGLKAASDLRALGFAVTLVERDARGGGLVGQLHSLYPDGAGGARTAGELLARARAAGVDLRLGSEVRAVTGFVGNFHVEIGPVGAAADGGSDDPGRTAGAGGADRAARAHRDCETIETGAIVIAIGAAPYAPAENEFGFGRLANVITSFELEKQLAASAEVASGGAGGQAPGARGLAGIRSVAFIQCVGSRQPASARTPGGAAGCSRVCCPASIQQAFELTRLGIASVVCYRDMRMAGTGAEERYREARAAGTLFLRYAAGDPPEILADGGFARAVRLRETLLQREVEAEVDLVVLAVGLVPRTAEAARVQEMLKTPQGADGFFLERHPELAPVETCVDGVVLCGTAQGPKDARESLVQASAAAARVVALLGQGRLFLEPAVCRVDPARCRGCGLCVSICQFRAPTLVSGPSGAPVAVVNAALCKGCGTCAVWCPTNAIRAAHFTDDQIVAMIDGLFAPAPRARDEALTGKAEQR